MQTVFAFINSPQDWIVILIIGFLLFGAKKLPELARGMGKAMGEFKKARDDFEREISLAVKQAEEQAAAKQIETREPAHTEPAAAGASGEPVVTGAAGNEPGVKGASGTPAA